MQKKTTIYNSIGEYLEAMNRWINTTATINGDGKMFVHVNGELLAKDEWDTLNPKPNFEMRSGNDTKGNSYGLLYGVKVSKNKKGR